MLSKRRLCYPGRYVIRPSTGQVARWGVCFSMAAVVGCWSINPDGGSYPQWEAEVGQLIGRYRQPFAEAGCNLGLQQTRCRQHMARLCPKC